jgi:RNA polymerase sigma-70 factor (ECF subfamily)
MKLMSNSREVDEQLLLKSAQDGDAEAFGELYEFYAPAIFRFIYAHIENRLDAEDITEDVFFRAWRSLPGYKEQGVPFIALLFRIGRNAIIDHYRRSAQHKQQTSIEEIVLHDGRPSPVETVITNLEHQEVREVLEKLREDYRTVLALRFLSELSPEETAKVMGRSAGAVRVLQHRALTALRALLDGT